MPLVSLSGASMTHGEATCIYAHQVAVEPAVTTAAYIAAELQLSPAQAARAALFPC